MSKRVSSSTPVGRSHPPNTQHFEKGFFRDQKTPSNRPEAGGLVSRRPDAGFYRFLETVTTKHCTSPCWLGAGRAYTALRSDGIFAFAATLLVLGIHIPQAGDLAGGKRLIQVALEQWHPISK
ncbi:MAG TPA: hypothetical protein VN963_02205 [bacterium]|nr:hypothetical protein [bacterium]